MVDLFHLFLRFFFLICNELIRVVEYTRLNTVDLLNTKIIIAIANLRVLWIFISYKAYLSPSFVRSFFSFLFYSLFTLYLSHFLNLQLFFLAFCGAYRAISFRSAFPSDTVCASITFIFAYSAREGFGSSSDTADIYSFSFYREESERIEKSMQISLSTIQMFHFVLTISGLSSFVILRSRRITRNISRHIHYTIFYCNPYIMIKR